MSCFESNRSENYRIIQPTKPIKLQVMREITDIYNAPQCIIAVNKSNPLFRIDVTRRQPKIYEIACNLKYMGYGEGACLISEKCVYPFSQQNLPHTTIPLPQAINTPIIALYWNHDAGAIMVDQLWNVYKNDISVIYGHSLPGHISAVYWLNEKIFLATQRYTIKVDMNGIIQSDSYGVDLRDPVSIMEIPDDQSILTISEDGYRIVDIFSLENKFFIKSRGGRILDLEINHERRILIQYANKWQLSTSPYSKDVAYEMDGGFAVLQPGDMQIIYAVNTEDGLLTAFDLFSLVQGKALEFWRISIDVTSPPKRMKILCGLLFILHEDSSISVIGVPES